MKIVKKVLKWTGITLLALLVIIILLPIIFKGKIIQVAKEQANKNLNAKVNFGDIDLSLLSTFPYFTLSADNLSVVGINEFNGDTLISAKRLALSINLMSVIEGGTYKIRKIFLDSPRVFAKVLKDGEANWNITKPSVPSTPGQPSKPKKFKLSLKLLDIKNGDIVYDDASIGFYLALNGINHKLSGDFSQDDFLLKINTAIKQVTMSYGGIKYLNNVNTTIQADVDANMPKFKFVLKDNKITLNALSFGIYGYFAMPDTNMDMDLKFNADQSDFKNFLSLVPGAYTKDFASVKTSGKLAFNGHVKGVYNSVSMPAYGLNVKITNAMFQYPSLPKSANNIQMDVSIDNKTGKTDNTVIDVNKFHVEMAGNPVDIKMHVETPVSDPYVNGTVNGKVDLSSIKDVMPLSKDQQLSGIVTANLAMDGRESDIEKQHYDQFKASGEVKVQNMNYKSKNTAYNMDIKDMDLTFSPQAVQLASFDANIGKSDIHANGKVENFLQYYFKKDVLKGEFNITSSLMDLNQFTSSDAAKTPTRPAADTSSVSVIDVPANIDFVLTSSIDKLLYENIEMNKVSGKVTIKNQVASLDNLKMNLLDGSMDVSGDYNTRNPKKPEVNNFKLDIKNFDITKTCKAFPTVQKLAPVGKYAQGNFSAQILFNTQLDSKMKPVYNTLNGNGTLQTKSVTISGFAPIDKLADALKQDKYKKLTLNNVNLSFHFEKGRVTVAPFDVKIGDTKTNIWGSTGFDQTIDYHMDMQVPRSDFGAANNVLQGLVAMAANKGLKVNLPKTVNINVKFGGTVTKPTVQPVFGGAGGSGGEQDSELEAAKKQAKAAADSIIKAQAAAAAAQAKKEMAARAQAIADSIKKSGTKNLKNDVKGQLKGLFKKHK